MIDPKIILLVLNWNGNKTTIDCILSLQKVTYSNYSILLIDNASTDGSLEIIKDKFPKISILQLDKNYGYSRGMNKGLEYIKSENPETLKKDKKKKKKKKSPKKVQESSEKAEILKQVDNINQL